MKPGSGCVGLLQLGSCQVGLSQVGGFEINSREVQSRPGGVVEIGPLEPWPTIRGRAASAESPRGAGSRPWDERYDTRSRFNQSLRCCCARVFPSI